MTLINLGRIKRAVFLDEKVYSEIAEDKNALVQAIIVVFLTGVMSEIKWILSAFPTGSYNKIDDIWVIIYNKIDDIWVIIFGWGFYPLPIPILAGWFIGTGIMHITAKLLGGKADFMSYLKAIGFAEVPKALGPILFINWLIGAIWCFTCYVTATKVVHRLSTGKAIIVAVIEPIILMVLIEMMIVGITSLLE